METLQFHTPAAADIPEMQRILSRWRLARTCDFSLPTLMLWRDFFHTEISIVRDTLFMRCGALGQPHPYVYMLPVGPLPLEESVSMLPPDGCELRLVSVPETLLAAFPCAQATTEPGWADYIYSINDLATLPGSRYKKKRNHVSRFKADNPGWQLVDLTEENAPEVEAFLERMPLDEEATPMERYERGAVVRLLRNLSLYPMVEGALLTTTCTRGLSHIVAFTLGHAAGDTLMVPVEKMDHAVAGAGQAINQLFAARMLSRHPELRYVNREEDLDDPGLRRAKESYHPLHLIRKFTLTF